MMSTNVNMTVPQLVIYRTIHNTFRYHLVLQLDIPFWLQHSVVDLLCCSQFTIDGRDTSCFLQSNKFNRERYRLAKNSVLEHCHAIANLLFLTRIYHNNSCTSTIVFRLSSINHVCRVEEL